MGIYAVFANAQRSADLWGPDPDLTLKSGRASGKSLMIAGVFNMVRTRKALRKAIIDAQIDDLIAEDKFLKEIEDQEEKVRKIIEELKNK